MVYRGKRRKERDCARHGGYIVAAFSNATHAFNSVNASAGENAGSATLLYRASPFFLFFYSLSRHKYIYAPPVAPREIHVYLSWRIERGVTRAP